MNYYKKQSKNTHLKGEKWAWVKITLFVFFMLAVSMFGAEILKLINY